MSDYERWLALCAEHEEADRAHRRALTLVTAKMQPGSRENPSDQEMGAWEAARDKLFAIRDRMDAFMRDMRRKWGG